MSFSNALDGMPRDRDLAVERLRQSLALFDEGVALQRLNFRRRHPALSEIEIEQLLESWLAREEAR